MKNKFKYTVIALLAVVIIGGGVLYLFRKQIIKYYLPEVRLTGDVHITIKNDTTYIHSKLTVRNKTFLKLKIDTLTYKISLFGETYFENKKFIGVELDGYQEDTIDFSLKIPYKPLLKDLKTERKKADSATYSIVATLQLSNILGALNLPINKTSMIKIPQPPEIEVMDIKYTKVRWKKILADVKIRITNNSNVSLSIKNLSYYLNISKKGNISGIYYYPTKIKPKQTTYISIPVEINVKNMGKTIFDIIINNDSYDYVLTMNATLESTEPFTKTFQIDITKYGSMELKK